MQSTVCITYSERENFGFANCERSGTSSQSKASFHGYIGDFQNHDFSINIDFWDMGYRKKMHIFDYIKDVRDDPAVRLLDGLFIPIIKKYELEISTKHKY